MQKQFSLLKGLMLPFSVSVALASGNTIANEGQWQPHQLPLLKKELSAIGIELPAKQIADLNSYPLNAVVGLGYCSASFVSPEGLVVTNHHCAYGAIQHNSSKENNLIEKGFIAKTKSDELHAGPQERLYLTKEVTDVTDTIFQKIPENIGGKAYFDAIETEKKQLIAACESSPDYRCQVRSFHHGMQYFLIKKLMIKDVRLVYAPSLSVGAFGGDIDNFEYPRHTGDYSFFRAYVSPDGKPAEYSEKNVPFKPKSWLKVSKKGVMAGDPILLAGWPGRTSRYKLTSEIQFASEWSYPTLVEMNLKELAVIAKATKGDEAAEVTYSSRVKSINNRMKKRQGLLDGFRVTDIYGLKQEQEAELVAWMKSTADGKAHLQTLTKLQSLLDQKHKLQKQAYYYRAGTGSSLLNAASKLYRLAKEQQKDDHLRESGYQNRDLPMFKAKLKRLQSRFKSSVDTAIWTMFVTEYLKQPTAFQVYALNEVLGIQPGMSEQAISTRLADLINNSSLSDLDTRLNWIGQSLDALDAANDPMIKLAAALYDTGKQFEDQMKELDGEIAKVRPAYMKAIIEFNNQKGKPVYPDANSTLRVTYGTVDGYPATDGVYKTPFTSVRGMINKNTGVEPFNAPQNMMDVYAQRVFGDYYLKSVVGKQSALSGLPQLTHFNAVPVNFLSSADTTGGNSGSAVMNGKGELVGLNFDSTYESITKDWYFNPAITRAIHVDIRYILWMMEYVDGAKHLMEEMDIVE